MKKTLMIHGLWALAVLAAFGLGSRNGGTASESLGQDSSGTGQPTSASRLPDLSSESRAALRGDRRAAGRDSGLLSRLFGAISAADGDMDSLIAQALKDPNPITRRLAFARLLESMTPENAATIRAQMVALGADGDQWRDFHYGWGAIAGKEAFDHAAGTPEADMAATLTGWAAANPSEAIALLGNLPPEMQGQRDELTASVVAGLADNNRAMATDLVLRLGQEGNERAGNLMEIVANETVRAEGPEAASRWSESLPDGALKSTAMSRIAEAYVRKDPEAAARWAAGIAGEDYASRAIEQIGGRWARSNPVAAVGWLESLPAGGGQAAGLRNAFSDWEDSDPVAAGEYLTAMPRSPQRDSAISGFASGYAWQNPQLAIAWAQDIADPQLRQTSLTRVGQAFYRRDPEGAVAWMETSGLPTEARQEILNSRNRR